MSNPVSPFKTPDEARVDLGLKPTIEPKTRALLLTVRQALLMVLGGIEEYLGIERSVTPRHRRD